jgi:PDZ domain-containing secreted protein
VGLTVERDGKLSIVNVTLKNKDGNTNVVKKEEANIQESAALGAFFEPLSKEECKKLNVSGGLKVTDIDAGKLAAAGVKEGFVITSVDNKKVSSVSELNEILKNKSGGTLIQGVYPNSPGRTFYFGIGL